MTAPDTVPPAAPGTGRAAALAARAGIPRLRGHGTFVSATAIDSLGTGLILAFTVVYFDRTTSVPLTVIGAAMTIARMLAVPTSVTVGPLIDRFGARHVAVVANAVSAVGYCGFLLADRAWSVVVVLFVVQVGHTAYWTSNGALIAQASAESQRRQWFGFVHALRNCGMGVGGALGAFAFAVGDTRGLYVIAVANAVSYCVAALLLTAWRPAATAPARGDEPTFEHDGDGATGYRQVLRDRRYALLLLANVTFVFAQMLLKVLLAIYILEALEEDAWIAGTLIMVATVQVALTQTYVTRRSAHHRVTRVIMLAAVVNAVSFGLFAALYAAPDAVVLVGLFVAMTVFTFGEVLGFPAIDALSVSLAPERVRGRYLAVFQLSWTFGEVLAPVVLTALLARAAVAPMLFLLVLSLAAVPLLLRLERSLSGHESDTRPAAVPPAAATDPLAVET